MSRITAVPIFVAVVALLAAAPAAAATPVYWPPAKMASALTALQYPHEGILGGVCRGATKARHGTYAGFRCVMTWQITGTQGNPTESGKATVWAKPLARGRVCASTRSLKACKLLPAGPLPGDPRLCSSTSQDACVAQAAKAAATAHWKAQTGYSQPAPSCTKQTTFVYQCVAGQPPTTWTYTVMFVKGPAGWTTTVTP